MVAMLNFAPLLPLVREEFALTNAWAGTLATATILSHTLLQLPGGYLADRIGVKRAVELGLLVMALSVIASAFATSMVLLLACRFLLGAGTATAFISTLSCVNVLVPTEKRAVAQGLFGAAANVGVLLLLLLSERMAHWEGWRGTFLMEGILILGIAWLFAAWFRLETGASQVRPASWGETVRDRPLYLLGLAHILSYGVFTALSTWMATFLWEAHGIGLEWAGPLAALLPGPGLAVLDLLLLGWFASMPFGAIFSYVPLVCEKGASGRGFSLVNFVGNVGALAFPPAIGYALDATGSFTLGFGLVALVGLAESAAVAAWLPRPGR